MDTLRRPARITSQDRFGLTLFLAGAVHAVVILGVTFRLTDPAPPDTMQRMEITLVHQRSKKPPQDADYLAQANQDGGGDVKEKVRPRAPASTPYQVASPGEAQQRSKAATPPRASQMQRQVITVSQSDRTLPDQPTLPVPVVPDASAAELIQRSLEMASLSAEISRARESFAQRPRQKFISAKTREYKYAAYEEAWRIKVERIGNLNYPDEAKRRRLSGTLMLDVALKPDGSLQEIRVLRPSGEPVLDDAAQRIVRLAAPFAPFPQDIRRDTDILHIIRTWRFETDYRLTSEH